MRTKIKKQLKGKSMKFVQIFTSLFIFAMTQTACRTTGIDDSSVMGLAGCGSETDLPATFQDPQISVDLSLPINDDKIAIRDRVSKKIPLVVYMAVDTDEPFMKLAVDHEVHSLRKVCTTQNPEVNWIVFLNSLLVATDGSGAAPVIARCDAGIFKQETLPDEVIRILETKRDLYSTGQKCTPNSNTCLRINQPFFSDKGSEFRAFPLAHPDILLDMLMYTRTLYPADRFAYFLHIKSHGSEDFLMTGLSKEAVDEKSKCQAEIIKNHHSKHPEHFVQVDQNSLGQVGLGQVGLGQVGLGQVGLGQVGLGQVGLGQVGLGQVGLGQVGLGQVGLGQVGLGQVGLGKVGGLGLGAAGLGTSNHYGSRHLTTIMALRWFTTRGTGDEDLAFVFFESCESRASRMLQHQSQNCAVPSAANPLTSAFNNIEKVHAFYSAAQSLWYRNLDWDTLYESWLAGTKTAGDFQSQLIETSKKIPNFNFASQDPLPLCQ